MSATTKLVQAGQSIWLDNITRDLLDDGRIKAFIDELGVTGLTSNPSIFDKAVAGSAAYDEAITRAAADGASAEEIFFSLAIDDLTRAADLFRAAHDASDGVDGWVSLEVSPELADDAPGTLAAASELSTRADRQNLFIKIPGTPAGLLAIEEAIAAGIHINVTLLFSTAQYIAAADAYLKGLERRRAAGLDLKVHSVASLFVSRWDVATAAALPVDLRNRVGIAVAADAYAASCALADSERVAELADAGAPFQRLLFASTGTKDPAASDTLYVSNLVAPGTVNTMPDSTLLAFADHGEIPALLDPEGVAADDALTAISAAGVDLSELAERLQREGKDAFVASWTALLATVEEKAGRAR